MNTRREFIRNAFSMSGMLLGGVFLFSGCGDGKKPAKDPKDVGETKKTTSCSDLSGISEEEKDKRKKLGYVEETPIEDSKCGNCKLYLPPGENESCGSCSLFKGPVEENGYCTYYAPLS